MKKNTGTRSRPENVLALVVAALEQSDQGFPLQGMIPNDHPDARIAQNLLLTIVRHQAVIDWILDGLASRRIRPRLRRVLRWGVCQILYMQGLPDAVVTDTCAHFVKKRYDKREAGFVNAVLRQIVAGPADRFLEAVSTEAPLHVRLELGQAVYRKWAARFSESELQELAAVLLEPVPVTARLRAGAPMPQLSFMTSMAAPSWAPDARLWLCHDPKHFFQSTECRRGDFYVQDPATLLAPALLKVRPGETVADLCVAPGGKALQMAEAMQGQGRLFCLDRSARRMQRVRQNLAGQPHCFLAVGDAITPPLSRGAFDAIMLDVPCSNTGVIRRRPDVRWHFSAKKLNELVVMQQQILQSASSLLKPGGRLVYSTCSIEPEENAGQIGRFLANSAQFKLAEEVEILPTLQHDGAYSALLLRDS